MANIALPLFLDRRSDRAGRFGRGGPSRVAGCGCGLGHLRVIDASIIPEVPSVPTNVTTIMVAEYIYRHTLAR